MDRFIKEYRKSVGLIDTALDSFIRIIFVIHLCLAVYFWSPIHKFFYDLFEFFDLKGNPESFLAFWATLTILHYIPRVVWWMAKPIIKK